MAAQRHLEHLPPGAQPGPQSKRRGMNVRGGGCLAPVLAVAAIIFFALFAGFALLLGAIADDIGDGFGGPDPAWFWLVAVGGTALFVFVAVTFWRKANLRRDKALSIRLDRHRARRGEELHATVSGIPERAAAEVTLGCRVHWDRRHRGGLGDAGDRVSNVVAENIVWEESAPASPSGAARLRLPDDQPYSHEGQVISFAWMVNARTVVEDKRGKPSAPAAVWVDP